MGIENITNEIKGLIRSKELEIDSTREDIKKQKAIIKEMEKKIDLTKDSIKGLETSISFIDGSKNIAKSLSRLGKGKKEEPKEEKKEEQEEETESPKKKGRPKKEDATEE